jgi:hypothetical protein
MSRAKLPVSDELLLRDILRLGADAKLVGAHVRGHVLMLDIDFPAAPDGADEAEPVYVRVGDAPDPVQVIGIQWRRKGEVIAFDRPAPNPLVKDNS